MKKAILFIFSGGMSAFTALILFYIFFNIFHFWYLLASIISFALSVGVGFYLQKNLTFKNNDSSLKDTRKQAIIFLVISIINLLINILLMLFFVEVLSFHNKMFAKVLTLGILALWNYFIYQKFVFKK